MVGEEEEEAIIGIDINYYNRSRRQM